MTTMESAITSSAIPQPTLGAVGYFNSTITSSDSTPDNTSSNDSLAVQNAKPAQPKKKRNAGERIQRSRERNRIHARKTRQRKKEQLQALQNKAEQLKGEQIELKLRINENISANILSSCFSGNQRSHDDPMVEALMIRPEEEIPDHSKLPALQPLILPSGAQHSKRNNLNGGNNNAQQHQLPNDGIDYELLGKDRSKCTPSELDQIRRERNRMHAKRTRDRKRLFMEEMAEMCKGLERENSILQHHLDELNGVKSKLVPMVSPSLSPTIAPTGEPSDTTVQESPHHPKSNPQIQSVLPLTSQNGASFDQMKTLLDAAGMFDLDSDINSHKSKNSNANFSCVISVTSEDTTDPSSHPSKKRRRLNGCSASSDEDGGDLLSSG
mmetsp:Transcript_16735/g.38268  ORF Transcript_16735/g.38268 Transcript_16735/m.38268 type:complete len:382 (+) Transcript_16735:97-1242(+)